ncbi:MAG: deoxynucleoside kinase [Chloroflexota bacterium]
MGLLIAIVGNCGTGKSTFTHRLCELDGYEPYLEQHIERPFQTAFFHDLKQRSFSHAFLNQMDYLLYRSEQELDIRRRDIIGVQDGGLDQDFHLFTRLFLHKGYLNQDEYDLCRRFYDITRALLPVPDVVIIMRAPLDVLLKRLARRRRETDIVQSQDLELVEYYLDSWLANIDASLVITIDSSQADETYTTSILDTVAKIRTLKEIRQ